MSKKKKKKETHADEKRMSYIPFIMESHFETNPRHNFTLLSGRMVLGCVFLLLLLVRIEAVCVLWRPTDLDSNTHLTEKNNLKKSLNTLKVHRLFNRFQLQKASGVQS